MEDEHRRNDGHASSAFAGTFSATLEPTVRARLGMPCDVILADETGIVARLADVDVLVTLAFTREMGAAASRLKLVQVPGAGLDRIDRAALPAGASLANVYGHEVGIAEYVVGAMLTLTRDFARLDAALRRATTRGAKVLSGPMDVPGGGRIAQLQDPQGAAFALHHPAVHLAGNLPLALAKHMIDRRSHGRQPPRDFTFRRARGKTLRKFLGDKAGGKLALAPARMVHQRRQERNVVPDTVDVKRIQRG